MESENETRPLLHDFESETWRSKARKRCLRIPSEVAITGIILGLFFVVVTLLIVLENIEDTKESEISVDKSLLASPFKYNKKAEDMSWQDKKDSIKAKTKQNDLKWDNANKGWKKFPDISEQKDPDMFKNVFENTPEIATLLQSPKLQWDEIDVEWKRLTKQGWKDKEIRDAFVEVLKEKEAELKGNEGVLQSPTNLDQLWDKINDSWKKKMQEGNKELVYQKMKGKKEVERQKNISDEWKNKMALLQSPKADMKNIVKADDGWKRLSEQGWKIQDLKKAIIEAWKEKEDLSQSPMNLQNLLGKASDILKNVIQKGMDKQKSQKDINDDWANKFGGNLQSPQSSIKKGSFIDELLKKRTKYDPNDKSSDKAGQQDETLQTINYKDFLENIVEMIKEYQKDHETENFDKAGKEKENTEYSSMNVEDFLKNIIDTIKELQKGNKEAEKQKSTNDEWKNMNVLHTSKNSDQKWKKVDDHWKTLIEYERNSQFGKNDDPVTRDDGLKPTMSFENIKWDKTDNGWKKLTEQGWKDEDVKEAVYKAWKDGHKLLQSAMGYNNMKWKKVNDGWKKISNKS